MTRGKRSQLQRRVVLLGLALAGVAPALRAQQAGQFEVGAFGSYTRYDKAFGLDNRAGGGARLGYFFGKVVGLEAEVLFQPNYTVSTGGAATTLEPLIASGSLVFNALRGARMTLYALGGYSLLDFGTRAPYHFTDNAAHAAGGARIFLTNRIALRLEGRAIYTASTKSTFGATAATHYVATAGLSVFHLGAPPKYSEPPKYSDKNATPATKATCPNAAGCPPDSDSDKDGVPDGLDKCPDTPAGAHVDGVGCPTDADQDGVPDGVDRCPNTPPGTRVDTTGCPLKEVIRDSDGDGVPDNLDKCPNTPPGSRVDASGCIILFQPEAVSRPAPGARPRPTLILRGVNFEWGRSALTPDSYALLDQVAGSLLANPEIRIEIAGYTDNTGSPVLNVRLSQARAAAVRAYLARQGVSPGRMIAKGYGAAGFVAPNTTAAGRAQNRRVELHKLP